LYGAKMEAECEEIDSDEDFGENEQIEERQEVSGYRVVHSYAELVEQPRPSVDLTLSIEQANAYM